MARKKPARPAAKRGKKKATTKAAVRKSPKKTAKKAKKKANKPARKAVKTAVKTAKPKAVPPRASSKKVAPRKVAKTPNLDRPRKTVADIHSIPSSLGSIISSSSAKSGRAGARHKLHEHTSSSPALTAGDVDADWASADSTGDEAPGGDNPTPDQDVVDEIGRALGVEYADDEVLQGGDEIADRDRHRWELNPNSKDDFEDTE